MHGHDEATFIQSIYSLFIYSNNFSRVIVKKKRATVNVYRTLSKEEFKTSKIKKIFHVLHENISK